MANKKSSIKKFIFYLFFAAIFAGCSKQKESISDLTKEVMDQKTAPAIRLAYSFLSVEEKSILWLTKLNAVLKNDNAKLTNNQKSIILEIKSMLDRYGMSALIKNGTIGERFLNENLEGYKKHFTNSQLYLLIENPYYKSGFSIFESDTYLNSIQPSELVDPGGGGGGGSNCTCYYNISCGLFGYCNWKVGCTQVTECGLFGTSNCKGKCD